MLFVNMEKNKIMHYIEIAKFELTGHHIGIMLYIESANLKLNGGHIGIMLYIKSAELE